MTDYTDGAVELGAARTTIVSGFFDSRAEAETAADRLRAMGLGGQVRVTEGSRVSDADEADATGHGDQDDRGFFERLGDFLFPDEDRTTYAEGLSRGGYLVTATGLSSTSYDLVMDALEDAGAVDIDERAVSWRAEGWTGGRDLTSDEREGLAGSAGVGSGTGYASGLASGSSQASGAGNVGSELAGEGRSSLASSSGSSAGAAGLSGGPDAWHGQVDETVPLAERLRVGKRDTSHGRARVRSYLVDEPVSGAARLEDERDETDATRRRDDDSLSGHFRSGRPISEVEAESGLDDDEDLDATGLTERDVNRP